MSSAHIPDRTVFFAVTDPCKEFGVGVFEALNHTFFQCDIAELAQPRELDL